MKRAAIVVAMLGLVSFVSAQQSAPANQNPPAAQSGSTPAAAPATPPQGKRPPQAKTQPEFDAYQAAVANSKDPAAMEKAADDFAAKYPDSELRILLYRSTMHEYQAGNGADKMLEMGRKVLAIDADDPEALIGVSEVLVERTRDNDLDKEQRWDEATKDAQHALQTIDTDLAIPASAPPDKVEAYKNFLKSSVYSILGTLEFNREKFGEAENYFHKSIDVFPSQPDPVVVLRLALALDKQGKYADALKQADQAVDLTQNNPTVNVPAKRERDRLIQLTGGIPVPDSTPPANSQTPVPPKN